MINSNQNTMPQDSDSAYRMIIENSSDLIVCADPNGKFEFVNNAFCSMLGKNKSEVIGKTFWDVYPKKEADGRLALIQKVVETSAPQPFEFSVPFPDKTLHFAGKANPVKDDSGKTTLVIMHATDITERKKNEQQILDKQEELEKMNKTMIDRELKMVELKEEIERLKKK